MKYMEYDIRSTSFTSAMNLSIALLLIYDYWLEVMRFLLYWNIAALDKFKTVNFALVDKKQVEKFMGSRLYSLILHTQVVKLQPR